jgi:hypothetical protein
MPRAARRAVSTKPASTGDRGDELMSASDDLPTDAVLRRHALTERNRLLGLPPTDAVLKRHYAQWQAAQAARGAAPKAVAAPVRPAAPAVAARPAPAPVRPTPAVSAPAPAPASGGGLLGWIKRLFGG